MRGFHLVMLGLAMGGGVPAAAGLVAVPAENQAPVTMVGFTRTAKATEVRLEAQAALKDACWAMAGANSPYLLAAEHRYRLIGGDGIAICPKSRGYAEGDVMVLRFEPLRPGVREFSLIEGVGGESQILDPASATRRYWNFLHVEVK
jgi:hypothetical protein